MVGERHAAADQALQLTFVDDRNFCSGRALRVGAPARLAERGAKAAILGCTELGLLLPAGSPAALPLVDSTDLQARAAVRWMLG